MVLVPWIVPVCGASTYRHYWESPPCTRYATCLRQISAWRVRHERSVIFITMCRMANPTCLPLIVLLMTLYDRPAAVRHGPATVACGMSWPTAEYGVPWSPTAAYRMVWPLTIECGASCHHGLSPENTAGWWTSRLIISWVADGVKANKLTPQWSIQPPSKVKAKTQESAKNSQISNCNAVLV